ncbi:MAG TPA: FAD-dependent oxidoreductase [Gemmatimonadaceae bacterium]|nr:FAD-dependent oxidoreductase [Gemmatimonadaceae bacterium]
MVKSASVAVVGGGVVGASVAYHLAKRGVRDVVIFDRGTGPGNGSTSRATGGFRAQFHTPINVHLSLLARDKLRAFPDEIGADSGYRPYGYLFIAESERELLWLRKTLATQRSAGLTEACELDADAVVDLNPAVIRDRVAGATWCASDGFIRPMQILRGYLDAAERLGVRIEWNSDVREVSSRGKSRLNELVISGGNVSVDSVVNAGGPWAGMLRCGNGSTVPVKPLKRQVAQTVETTILPESMPMTIFVDNGFHLRVREGRVMLLKATQPLSDDPFDTTLEDGWISAVKREADERIPVLRDVAIDREACHAGLYEMSPDDHAILGQSPQFENLFLANGSSGHGVMHSPALGQLLSEIICDGVASSLDVSALRPTRFSERAPNPKSELL